MEELTRVTYSDYRPAPAATKNMLHFVLIWPLSAAALMGSTGGAYSPEQIQSAQIEQAVRPFIETRKNDPRLEYVRSVPQLLANIREVFGLKMSEVAQIFGVSRPAAYAWLDGALPKAEITTRLWHLSEQADQLKASGIDRADLYTRRPVLGPLSLLDVLKSGADIGQALAIVKESAAQETRTRQLAESRNSRRKPAVSAADEISTPIYRKDV
jgi:hypothetical protein